MRPHRDGTLSPCPECDPNGDAAGVGELTEAALSALTLDAA